MKKFILLGAFMFSVFLHAQISPSPSDFKLPPDVSKLDVVLAIQQLMQLTTNDAVNDLDKKNGFFKNNDVKIPLPPELQQVSNVISSVNEAKQSLASLEKAINRAAEEAVVRAKPILNGDTKNVSFSDAVKILLGAKNAATDYLQQESSDQLKTALEPFVEKELQSNGSIDDFNKVQDAYNKITGQNINVDLPGYVTNKMVDGIFTMSAKNEKNIRLNKALWTTAVLSKVLSLQKMTPF